MAQLSCTVLKLKKYIGRSTLVIIVSPNIFINTNHNNKKQLSKKRK